MSYPEFDSDSALTDEDELVSDEESEEESEEEPEPETQAPRPKGDRRKTRSQTAAEANDEDGPRLKPPCTVNRTLVGLYDEIIAKRLDLEPEYQRDVVWPDAKQTALIDSLINNYPVPPLIFAVTYKRGIVHRTCIDGKQRLSSILRFMNGEIPHKVMGKKYYWKEGKNKLPLSEADVSRFKSANISCVEYNDLSEHFEREIFQRVQLGVALTAAERLTALNTPCANLVRRIKRKLVGSVPDGLAWNHTRGKDFNTVAQVVYLMIMDKSVKCEPTLTKLSTMLSAETVLSMAVEQEVENVIDIFIFIAHDDTLGVPLRRRKLTSMEILMILHLINLYRTKFSMTQLSDGINKLIAYINSKSKTKTTPAKAYKDMLAYVKGVKTLALVSDPKGDTPASQMKLPAPDPAKCKSRASTEPPPPPPRKGKTVTSKASSSHDVEKKEVRSKAKTSGGEPKASSSHDVEKKEVRSKAKISGGEPAAPKTKGTVKAKGDVETKERNKRAGEDVEMEDAEDKPKSAGVKRRREAPDEGDSARETKKRVPAKSATTSTTVGKAINKAFRQTPAKTAKPSQCPVSTPLPTTKPVTPTKDPRLRPTVAIPPETPFSSVVPPRLALAMTPATAPPSDTPCRTPSRPVSRTAQSSTTPSQPSAPNVMNTPHPPTSTTPEPIARRASSGGPPTRPTSAASVSHPSPVQQTTTATSDRMMALRGARAFDQHLPAQSPAEPVVQKQPPVQPREDREVISASLSRRPSNATTKPRRGSSDILMAQPMSHAVAPHANHSNVHLNFTPPGFARTPPTGPRPRLNSKYDSR